MTAEKGETPKEPPKTLWEWMRDRFLERNKKPQVQLYTGEEPSIIVAASSRN